MHSHKWHVRSEDFPTRLIPKAACKMRRVVFTLILWARPTQKAGICRGFGTSPIQGPPEP